MEVHNHDMKEVRYSFDKIDVGIKECLANCEDLIHSAKVLLTKGETVLPLGQSKNEVTRWFNCSDNEKAHCYVLYSFGIEEFGKAILLKWILDLAKGQTKVSENIRIENGRIRFRKNANSEKTPLWSKGFVVINTSKREIIDSVVFTDHDAKIQTALNEIGSIYTKLVPLNYPNLGFYPDSNIPRSGALTPMEGFEEGLMGFENRLSVLYVNVIDGNFAKGIGSLSAISLSRALEEFEVKSAEWAREFNSLEQS